MLGHRGCRLGITFPEITAMQTRAILGAACELKKEGYNPCPEIMVPLYRYRSGAQAAEGYHPRYF